ncbi:unnamed protein product [Nippostrongylus brasiliensis]|uniref:Uncharacterized protein n=1 Tax=Nippostrongylus brasiliensis TaxID=27835 RepID=A0A3P7C718_NIPBR|nr:unnamed protein product [Nippostrongylus brasiliensis]
MRFKDVITRFSSVPEPEFPGHVILEQFQAQVVQRLMSVCDIERAHLDLPLAKELQMSSGKYYTCNVEL